MNGRRVGIIVALAIIIASFVGLSSCKSKATKVDGANEPTVTLKADSTGLLLTWVDDKGEFHVEETPGAVPESAREVVRVLDPSAEEKPDQVVVADLRVARGDGTYAVRYLKRTDFDAMALEKRKAHTTTLADEPQRAEGKPGSAATRAPIVLYSASWCGVCHKAAAWLKARHIEFVQKDIEQDEGAAAEMQRKLSKAGLRAGGVPVIDVRGMVFVGFDPQQIESAIAQTAKL